MSEQNTSHRFILSSDDQAGLVVIVTAIGLSWTLCTLLIRIVSKLSIKRSLGVEEILVLAASVSVKRVAIVLADIAGSYSQLPLLVVWS